MNEFKNYDVAASSFYSSVKINSLPILSWDIYASYYNDICKKYNDINFLNLLSKENKWSNKEIFDEELFSNNNVIVVTDTKLNIVIATQNILGMTGYTAKEVVGKNPNIFQGSDTCKKTKKIVKLAIKNERPFEVILVNYRKDGSNYNCSIKGKPIFNKLGKVVNFIAFEKEVA